MNANPPDRPSYHTRKTHVPPTGHAYNRCLVLTVKGEVAARLYRLSHLAADMERLKR